MTAPYEDVKGISLYRLKADKHECEPKTDAKKEKESYISRSLFFISIAAMAPSPAAITT